MMGCLAASQPAGGATAVAADPGERLPDSMLHRLVAACFCCCFCLRDAALAEHVHTHAQRLKAREGGGWGLERARARKRERDGATPGHAGRVTG